VNIDEPFHLELFGENLPSISYAKFYELTWAQIAKDFSHFVVVPELSATPTPSEMVDALMIMLGFLVDKPLQLNSLFYRIDLSEKAPIKGGDDRGLAIMILRREAQKVWIRTQYSSAPL